MTRLRLNGIKGIAYLHRSFLNERRAAAAGLRPSFLPTDLAVYRKIIYCAIVLISSYVAFIQGLCYFSNAMIYVGRGFVKIL